MGHWMKWDYDCYRLTKSNRPESILALPAGVLLGGTRDTTGQCFTIIEL